MYQLSSYVSVKTILVIPFIFIFSLCGIGIPGFLVQEFNREVVGSMLALFAGVTYVWESAAEAYSVWFPQPNVGRNFFFATWLIAVLFSGVFLSVEDMFWPFVLFYYILPYPYYLRSAMYLLLSEEAFEPCNQPPNTLICTNSTDGREVLEGIGRIVPVVAPDVNVFGDMVAIAAIAVFFKLLYIFGVTTASTRSITI